MKIDLKYNTVKIIILIILLCIDFDFIKPYFMGGGQVGWFIFLLDLGILFPVFFLLETFYIKYPFSEKSRKLLFVQGRVTILISVLFFVLITLAIILLTPLAHALNSKGPTKEGLFFILNFFCAYIFMVVFAIWSVKFSRQQFKNPLFYMFFKMSPEERKAMQVKIKTWKLERQAIYDKGHSRKW